jgi:acylphosphatase
MNSYKFIISGKVQKVSYRRSVQSNSKNYKGYVKNLSNGDVEAVVNLEEHKIEEFMEILKKGSKLSIVKNIYFEKIDLQNFKDFSIRY